MNHNLVSAVFDSHSEAERAITDLRGAGVSDSALSVVHQQDGRAMTSDGSGGTIDEDDGNKSGLVKGLLGGGAVGAALGIVALAIPGVGPLAAAGAIAGAAIPEGAAIGAALGAAGGGLGGYLSGHGVDDDDARYYEERINTGGVFVSVDTSDSGIDSETAREILYRSGGHSATRARATA